MGPVALPDRDLDLVVHRLDAGPSKTLFGMAVAPPRWPFFPWLRKQAHASGGAARLASSPGRQLTQTPEKPLEVTASRVVTPDYTVATRFFRWKSDGNRGSGGTLTTRR